jgi:hypothetical protein
VSATTIPKNRDSPLIRVSGLLGGEKLLLGLQNLERRFMETNYRDFEITQSISIAQLDPAALIQLRETGGCTFSVPEAVFDLAYPGYYHRLIKAARLTIPCVAGPFASVGAMLTLAGSDIRLAPELNSALTPIPPRRSVSIAMSTAQSDSGVFEFSFRDERYMPFEGAGAISSWELTLPKSFQSFDYQTISDVILQMSYTAKFGGNQYRDAVEVDDAMVPGTLRNYFADHNHPLKRALSLRQDLPGVFHQLVHSPVDTPIKIQLSEEHFPYFLKGQDFQLITAKASVQDLGTIWKRCPDRN